MSMLTVPHIHVACAIIERDGLVLAAQRGRSMNMPLKWEFPGGKIEPGESPQACLHRELQEEMGVAVDIVAELEQHRHHYPHFTITLYPFVCRIAAGNICLYEHEAVKWMMPHRLDELDWADADGPVIASYLTRSAG